MIQIKKTLLTLVALLAVTTGAWADETPLLTIESINYTSFTSGSMTFDDKVTITFSDPVTNQGNTRGWYANPTPSLMTVAGTNGYTITSCKFYTESGAGYTGYTVPGESPSVYLFAKRVYTDASQSVNIGDRGIIAIEVYGGVASAASGPKVAWDKDTKTGTFTMPGGNVTLEPEYYPQATLAFQGLTAAEDAAAKTEAPLAVVADGAVTGGTLMYYVATDKNFSQADAIALAETQWSADIPTAETIDAAGTYIMWYYIKGDAEHSDTDPIPLVVTLLPEPTYAVTFAEGTDPNEWTASPNADVKKGQTVTVTYTGSKKVIGVKAEKKAAAPAEGKTYTNLQGGEVLHVGDKITETEGKFRYTHHSNPQSTDYYTYIQSFNTYEVLRADVAYEDYNYKYTESPDGQYYVLKHTYYDDYEEEWFTAYYFNQDLPVTETSDGITVTLDGQDGSQRNLYTFWVHEPNQ